MDLFRYFKRQNTELPDPHDPLAQSVLSSAIVAANSKVISVMESGASVGLDSHTSKIKRGQYGKYSSEQKAMIGKRAVEHSEIAAVWYYVSRGFSNLKENTVMDWRIAYRLELKKRARDRSDEVSEGGISISDLPQKIRGHPLLLGEELDKPVQAYLTSFRESGAFVNTAITMACAEGIVRSADSNMLAVNGGRILITKVLAPTNVIC